MGHASQEIFVAARPSLFTLVRIRESVNRALEPWSLRNPLVRGLRGLRIVHRDFLLLR